ncbi:CBS domain-containing protein [Dongshaea marina]|uniref:CBS domain-containing protein n=1 Tax=Dongshaea marina TaxID=2047966 RepID=UPI000D3E3586|nr:CBS domain-containing protein [Dongshaea marina]
MRLADIMTTRLVCVSMDDRLEVVRDIFEQAPFRHLLVVDEHELMGIISDRDMMKAVSPYLNTIAELPRDRETLTKRAHQIMQRNPITASPSMTIPEASRILLKYKISCLPVLEAGRLVGIISWKDLLSAAIGDRDPIPERESFGGDTEKD